MTEPIRNLAEPLFHTTSRHAGFGRKALAVSLFVGLLFGVLLTSVTRNPEPALNLAWRGMQPTKAGQFMTQSLWPTFNSPSHSAGLQSVQPKPLQALRPMETVYANSFQPTNAMWMQTKPRPAQSMLVKASAQPVNVAADGSTGLPWVVMKFGGTSVSTKERWEVITTQMKKIRASGSRPFVAISALGSVTNRLIRSIDDALADKAPGADDANYKWVYDAHMALAKEVGVDGDTEGMAPLLELLKELERLLEGIRLTRECSPKLQARVSSFGELMSTQLGIMVIKKAGIPCVRLDARKLLQSTESLTQQDEDRYMQAVVNPKLDPDLVVSEMEGQGATFGTDPDKASAVLVQGFIGATPKGDACLLGRGGSDTSGALFAALVGAKRYEIWTDVHGLFTSDPRFVDGTRLIKATNYRTAQELATLGAKVLHERCLVPAQWGSIPVEIHNTADPDGPMTRIEGGGDDDQARLLGVTTRKGQVLLNIKTNDPLWGDSGFLGKVLEAIGELGVATDLVAVSQYTASLVLDYIPGGIEGEAFSRLTTQLKEQGKVTMKSPVAVVSVIGENLRGALPELGAALEEMRKKQVYMMTQSSEDLSISFVVDEDASSSVVQGLHNILLCGTSDTESCIIDDKVFGQSWDELKTEFLKVEAR